MSIKEYENNSPRLKIEEFFQGQTKAWGVFQDRFGKVRRQFRVDIQGTWDESAKQLTLKEDFVYDDGEEETRVWTIEKTGPHSYEGTEDNAIGKAKGESYGNAFHFQYDYNLPVDDQTWKVSFDDWMFLQDDNTLFNKADIRRWGIKLGSVYIFFRKTDAMSDSQFILHKPNQRTDKRQTR